MKNNQKGFSIVEIVVLVAVIGLIATGGWLLYTRQDSAVEPKSSTPQTASISSIELVDSSQTFSVTYPENWTVAPYAGGDYDEQGVKWDWTKTPQFVTLKNNDNPKITITIDGYTNIETTVDKEIEAGTKDQFNTYSKVTIGDYEAVKRVVDFIGLNKAEAYKETSYIVLSEAGSKVILTFRERYSNATSDYEDDFDASSQLPDFESIVNSIKFLK